MQNKHAFTIVELLVVVTIIVILISLVPGLESAKRMADRVVCASNLRTIGMAMGYYVTDSRKRYPELVTWNMLVGNRGANVYGEHAYDTSKDWPLNPYLGITGNNAIVKAAECPADAGDHLNNTGHSYTTHGTSYLPPFAADYFRVKKVYGIRGDAANSSMKTNQVTRTQNKVLLADWIWHANRDLAQERTHWHSSEERILNTLFTDLHVEYMDWINDELQYTPWNTLAPNRSHKFW